MTPEQVEEVRALIESQGTTAFVALALEELGLTFVEDVVFGEFFIGRVQALYEENQS